MPKGAGSVGEPRFISIRKLAALEIVYRGERRVLLEYGSGVFFFGVVGVLFLLYAHQRTPLTTSIGVYVLLLALNYVPLLAFSISLASKRSAKTAVALELEHQETYRRRYGIQQAMVLIPFAVLLLASIQEASRGSDRAGDPT